MFRFFSFFFFSLFLLGNVSAQSFSDLYATHRNYDAIEYVKTQGIVNGYSDGSFRPDNEIIRAEYTKVLIEAQFSDQEIQSCMIDEEKNQEHPFFNDIRADDWFTPYICVAVKNGLIGGYPDGSFRPANKIAFVEAAKIIVNLFAADNMASSGSDLWFKDYVVELADDMRAVPGTVQNFDQNMKRDEIAEMIYRVKEGITDKESLSFQEFQCENGDVYIPDQSSVDEICVKEGNIYIGDQVTVNGDIRVVKGDIKIGGQSEVYGDISMVEEGNLNIDSQVDVFGDILIQRGDLKVDGQINLSGKILVLQGNVNLGGQISADKGIKALRGDIILDNQINANYLAAYQGSVTLGSQASIKSLIFAKGAIEVSSQSDFGTIISYTSVILGEQSSATTVITPELTFTSMNDVQKLYGTVTKEGEMSSTEEQYNFEDADTDTILKSFNLLP